MKIKTKIRENLYHILSEPGDMTRYSYIVLQSGNDYKFMPDESRFRFPQRLNYFKHKDLIHSDNFLSLLSEADMNLCNPHTLKECIKTMIEIQEGL